MRKRDELADPASCLARAGDDEMVFVLLGRDPAAPAAIRAWIAERIRTGRNRPGDPQLAEAERCARAMEAERPAAPPLLDLVAVGDARGGGLLLSVRLPGGRSAGVVLPALSLNVMGWSRDRDEGTASPRGRADPVTNPPPVVPRRWRLEVLASIARERGAAEALRASRRPDRERILIDGYRAGRPPAEVARELAGPPAGDRPAEGPP
jgi:hypothetical protein